MVAPFCDSSTPSVGNTCERVSGCAVCRVAVPWTVGSIVYVTCRIFPSTCATISRMSVSAKSSEMSPVTTAPRCGRTETTGVAPSEICGCGGVCGAPTFPLAGVGDWVARLSGPRGPDESAGPGVFSHPTPANARAHARANSCRCITLIHGRTVRPTIAVPKHVPILQRQVASQQYPFENERKSNLHSSTRDDATKRSSRACAVDFARLRRCEISPAISGAHSPSRQPTAERKAGSERHRCRCAQAADSHSGKSNADQRSRDDHAGKPLDAHPRASRREQFRIALTEAFAPAQPAIHRGQKAKGEITAGGGRGSFGGLLGIQQNRSEQAREGERECQDVGKTHVLPVDPGEREQCPAEPAPGPEFRAARPCQDGGRRDGHRRQFNRRVEQRDRRAAAPAAAPQRGEARERREVERSECGAARVRTRTAPPAPAGPMADAGSERPRSCPRTGPRAAAAANLRSATRPRRSALRPVAARRDHERRPAAVIPRRKDQADPDERRRSVVVPAPLPCRVFPRAVRDLQPRNAVEQHRFRRGQLLPPRDVTVWRPTQDQAVAVVHDQLHVL